MSIPKAVEYAKQQKALENAKYDQMFRALALQLGQPVPPPREQQLEAAKQAWERRVGCLPRAISGTAPHRTHLAISYLGTREQEKEKQDELQRKKQEEDDERKRQAEIERLKQEEALAV